MDGKRVNLDIVTTHTKAQPVVRRVNVHKTAIIDEVQRKIQSKLALFPEAAQIIDIALRDVRFQSAITHQVTRLGAYRVEVVIC